MATTVFPDLTHPPREREIAALVARGHTNKQIAAGMGLAPRTVDTHVGRLLKKLGVPSRAAVAPWARAWGLVAEDTP